MTATSTSRVPTITADALRRRLEAGQPVTVLDIRPASEFEEWHVPGSRNVPAYEALKQGKAGPIADLSLPEDGPVVTVCGAGKTSRAAARLLQGRGETAYSLEGGIRSWSLAWNTAEVDPGDAAARIIQIRRTGKGCLSYLIGAGGEAAVIDASLPPEVYVSLAEERGWRITHVLDTHVHADHLSRSRLLAGRAEATLHLPEQERSRFDFAPMHDGNVLTVGDVHLRALRTPGHTGESTCYLLDDVALFTGDTLFTDGVGRPDLEATGKEAQARAEALYDSLQRLLCDVSHEALVLPGHTSQPAPFDEILIGDTMEAVRGRTETLSLAKDAFVERILGRIPPTPPNYERIVELNEAGQAEVEDLLDLEAGANRCAIS